ncbi:MAG: hypothetical protein U0269_19985 [Polyangiales bacterium]
MRTSAALIVAIALLTSASPTEAQQRAPSRQALSAAVRRFVSRDARAEECRSLGVVNNEHQYSCSVHSCAGACRSHFRVTVLGFRGARVRVVSREERDGSDTGRCGCCLTDL